MPDTNTHPFVCVKWPTNNNTFFTNILAQTNAELYLLYLIDGTNTASAQVVADANNTWKGFATFYGGLVVPLCSATHLVSSGGINWTKCDNDGVFEDPGQGKQALPYTLWLLSCDATREIKTVSHDAQSKLNNRLEISSGNVVPGKSGNDVAGTIEDITKTTSVLAQALALKWLLEHRPCATKAAIESSGLIQELCSDKTPAADGETTPATVPKTQ